MLCVVLFGYSSTSSNSGIRSADGLDQAHAEPKDGHLLHCYRDCRLTPPRVQDYSAAVNKIPPGQTYPEILQHARNIAMVIRPNASSSLADQPFSSDRVSAVAEHKSASCANAGRSPRTFVPMHMRMVWSYTLQMRYK